MKLVTQIHGSIAVLAPQGPLVADEAAQFHQQVESALEAKGGRVVVDMGGVPYVDSAGIESLLAVCSARRGPIGRPKIARLNDTCREALDLTDVLPKLEVFDTVENAMRSLNR